MPCVPDRSVAPSIAERPLSQSVSLSVAGVDNDVGVRNTTHVVPDDPNALECSEAELEARLQITPPGSPMPDDDGNDVDVSDAWIPDADDGTDVAIGESGSDVPHPRTTHRHRPFSSIDTRHDASIVNEYVFLSR